MGRLQFGRKVDSEWEGLCHKCGLCCYERERVAGGVRIDLSRPCPYLDTRTRRCTVYERRFEVTGLCSKVTVLHARFGRRMPLNCGYVRHYRSRKGGEQLSSADPAVRESGANG